MGELIVVEGIDGIGKTTLTKYLLDKMQEQGLDCVLLSKKEPKFSNVSEEIVTYSDTLKELVWAKKEDGIPLDFLTDKGWILQLSLWFVFLKENYIKKEVEKHDIVILDGWFYKLYGRFMQNVNVRKTLLTELLSLADIEGKVFLLQEQPEVCWTRRKKFKYTELGNYGTTIVDHRTAFIAFQRKVQNELLRLARERRWDVIACDNRSVEEIGTELIDKIESGETLNERIS